MTLVIIAALVFISAGVLSYLVIIPGVIKTSTTIGHKGAERLAGQLVQMRMRAEAQKLTRLYIITPIVMGALGYFSFPEQIRPLGIILGIIIGFVGPSMYVRFLINRRKKKFYDQLVDSLMIMSSSLRGGLSLLQAMEAVVEEMSDPINQEFGAVISENKMGVSLEEALNHLYRRMPSASLQQIITAVLLARETGGNLPVIFNRIVNTIRERRKIEENIKTLTLQGRIQGVVMSILPVAFGFVLYSTNPRYIDNMLTYDIGRKLLVAAVILETFGVFFIWRISRLTEY